MALRDEQRLGLGGWVGGVGKVLFLLTMTSWLSTPAGAETPARSGLKIEKASPESCALLDDPSVRERMDGLLVKLLLSCGRDHELGFVTQSPAMDVSTEGVSGAPDVQVNDSTGDAGANSHTQSETSIAFSETTGTICSGYNDSFHGVVQNQGFTGISRSTDGGATFTDLGPLASNSFGDPSLVWSRSDGNFYIAALESSGLGIWRSSDDCASFQFVANTHVGGNDDKEILAVDNNPASAFFGRLYVGWTNFTDSRIYVNFSTDNGATWSAPVAVSTPGASVQGAWPVVAPNGDVFVGWVRWNPFPNGPIDIEIVHSTDGGATFTAVTNPITNEVNPRDNASSGVCGRPALDGNIRYLPSPQLAVGPDGVLHVVYSYDQDGFDSGDEVDVFYRRSTDSGVTWEPEFQLNDDGTLNDQFFPTLSVGANNVVISTWYDRRLDPANLLIDYYQRSSVDGGVTWQPSIRLSDVSTPVFLDPNLAGCYHGDYDTQIQTPAMNLVQWSDDRNIQDGHNDSDVWFEATPISTDFLVTPDPSNISVCAPADAVYTLDVPQFEGFSEMVTLTTTNLPLGATEGFSVNPVTPPGSSILTVSPTATAAGSYSFEVVGTSSPSAIVHEATVGLNVFDQIPLAPVATAPADGAVDVDLVPVLSWDPATQAVGYFVEIATDAGFSNIVYDASETGTSHQVDQSLDPLTEYHWRVRAGNICGDGSFSAGRSFTTRDIPPILVVDDDDNTPDVRAQNVGALDDLGLLYDIWDTANSDNEPSAVDLAPYEVVVWFTGDEFGGSAGPGSSGETALADWLDLGGKCLFLSSQDYHFDRGFTTFMGERLGLTSVTNDTNQGTVTGAGEIFTGFGPFALVYQGSNFSDTLAPDASGVVAFDGNQGIAAVSKSAAAYRTLFFGFPFSAIAADGDRQAVMDAALEFCRSGTPLFSDGFESGDTSAWSSSLP